MNRFLVAATLAAASGLAMPALAKDAHCYTTEDGEYDCAFFAATDNSGSFEITAPGKPWFSIVIDSPGVASGYADYGTGRTVPLPGTFYRSQEDGACWENDTTDFEICAW